MGADITGKHRLQAPMVMLRPAGTFDQGTMQQARLRSATRQKPGLGKHGSRELSRAFTGIKVCFASSS